MGQALQWRYPQVRLARAPWLDARSARRPYTWPWYLAPMWQEEMGAALWRPTRHRRVELWGDPPACWHPVRFAASPSSRERRPPAGPTPWGWTGGAGYGTTTLPASPPPPNPGPAATWLDVANAVHALLPLVSDVWWAILPEPGEIHATARWPNVLCRVDLGLHQDVVHQVAQEGRRHASGWEQGRPPHTPTPLLPLAKGGPPPPATLRPPPPGAPAMGWSPVPTA